MTSQLSHRLKRVERDLKVKYPCPVCNGKGNWVVSYVRDGVQIAPPPTGCEGCGEANHITVKYVNKQIPRFDQDDTAPDHPHIDA